MEKVKLYPYMWTWECPNKECGESNESEQPADELENVVCEYCGGEFGLEND